MLAGALGVWRCCSSAPACTDAGLLRGRLRPHRSGGGCVDTAMNAASAARLMGRPGALVRFHAFFNTGALLAPLSPALCSTPAFLAMVVADSGARGGRPGRVDPSNGRRGDAPRPATDSPGARATGDTRGRCGGCAATAPAPLVHLRSGEVTEGAWTRGACCTFGPTSPRRPARAGAYVVGQSSPPSPGGRRSVLGRLSPRIALVVGGSIAPPASWSSRLARRRGRSRGSRTRCGRASLFWPS